MSWHSLLRCPRCSGTVAPEGEGMRCVACANRYPAVGGIAVLHAEAHAEIANWRHRIHEFLIDNDNARASLLSQLATDARLAGTRRRLEDLHQVLATHRDRLLALLEPAGLTPTPRTAPERAPVAGEGSITSYYHQIHRDWGWTESDEAEAALAAVLAVLGDARLGRMLVLGAGAARLAIDLHGARADTTIALDVNPLPFLIAKRLAAGEALQLFELPLRPRDSGHTFVDRTLRASALPDANFHFLFADGLTPPLVDGSIDTLLTPWFIDQIPTDMATLVPEIRRVLADGGRWVNFGPLLYQPTHTRLAHRYCFDEVLDLAHEAGFEVERHTIERMRYMESPACCQGRTELVLTFSAIKREPIARPEPARAAWREDLDAPVPRFAGLAEYQPPHPMFAAVAALIDGQRSARAIAAVLVAQHGLPADEAPAAVQACLGEIARKLGG